MFYIEKECLKCDACKQTGWKVISRTDDRNRAKDLKKYWQKFFGRELKIRIRQGE